VNHTRSDLLVQICSLVLQLLAEEGGQAFVDVAEKSGVAVMGGASFDGGNVREVWELSHDSFVWCKGALGGKVAGVEEGHYDPGGFVVAVASRQAKWVLPLVYQ
jgi:hypothetical protein